MLRTQIIPAFFAAALTTITACGRDPEAHADTTTIDSTIGRSWRDSAAGYVVRGVVAVDTPPVQQARPDSTRARYSLAVDSTARDSAATKDTTRVPISVKMAPGRPKKDSLALVTTLRFFDRKAASGVWPVSGPAPADGAILPNKRVIAFYGNPLSKRMGILGEIPPDQMLAKLDGVVKEWAEADPETPVQP